MSKSKVVSITDSPKNRNEITVKENLIRHGVHNLILETCGNSPSLGHGEKLDHAAVRLEIELFSTLLEACEDNPNFDSEIFFDSLLDDFQAIYKKLHGEFRQYQHIKLKLRSEDPSNK